MLVTLVFALLPIVVTIGLGILAGKVGDFDSHDSQQLTRLVLRYALPMSIFAGILKTPRKVIIADIPFVVWILVGMIGAYFVFWLVMRASKVERPVAILRSMSLAAPSVPFIGSAVLPLLFAESVAAIDIGISSLLMNVILVPVVFWQMSLVKGENDSLGRRVLRTLKQPLVFSALLAFILALCGCQLPKLLVPTFTTLGQSAGGLAMFATGIILFSHELKLTKQIAVNVFCRNLFVPLVIWGLMLVFKVPTELVKVVVVTLAIPTAAIPTILAIRYRVNETEIAATQFYSTVFAIVTMAFFMLMVKF